MTARRNPETLIRAFLEEGLTELPDRAFDAVRRDIHRTRQRTVIGPWKERPMITLARLAIAAAIVVVVGTVWINFGPTANFGEPPTETPIETPTQSPRPVGGPNQALDPGRYFFDYGTIAGTSAVPNTKILITVPGPGWTNFADFAVDKNYGPSDAEAGASFVVWHIFNRYFDGCFHPTPLDPAPGPGIDDILESLASQPGIEAGPLTDVTIDGYSAKYVELTVTVDIATCMDGFYPWLEKFVQGNQEVLRVYALDVEGVRHTFFLRIPARTTPEDRAELEQVVASVDIQP